MPACWAQINLQKAILKKMCDGERVLHFAEQGLLDDYMHWQFCENYRKIRGFGGSPSSAPTMTVHEIAHCIVELENGSYKSFCDQASELDKTLDLDQERRNVLKGLWIEWGQKHNKLVEEFDQLKRETRFGRPLYRPQKPSRWGGMITFD